MHPPLVHGKSFRPGHLQAAPRAHPPVGGCGGGPLAAVLGLVATATLGDGLVVVGVGGFGFTLKKWCTDF